MAVAQVYEFLFSLIDRKKKPSVISVLAGVEGGDADDVGFDNLIEVAEALEAILSPLTGGDIRSAGVTIPLAIFSANSADNDSDVEEGALFSFTAEGTTKHRLMRLPTFIEDKLLTDDSRDYELVNMEDDDVLTLLSAIDDGIDVNGVVDTITFRLCDSEKRVLDGVWSAEEDFRRRKKKR